MAGLLDDPNDASASTGLLTDDERRRIQLQNLFSTLIGSGLSAVAAGGRMTDAQRAPYLMQAAGTFANMPGNVQAQLRSEAQAKLLSAKADKEKEAIAEQRRTADAIAGKPSGVIAQGGGEGAAQPALNLNDDERSYLLSLPAANRAAALARIQEKKLIDRQPAQGYRVQPDGSWSAIPGGPADPTVLERNAAAKRAANEKAIPQTVTKGMQENLSAIRQVDQTLAELDKNPDSVGGPGSVIASIVPGAGNIQNRIDDKGTKTRAMIADIGSLKIHDRSGAAVTASEFPRLRPFIPSIADDPDTVRTKLANFRLQYEQTLRDTMGYYNRDQGFAPYKPAEDYLSGGGTSQPQAATPAPQTQQAPAYNEGMTATNPKTGQKLIFKAGRWVPM